MILLVILASACGGQAAKTTTKTETTTKTPASCARTIDSLRESSQTLLSATNIYLSQIGKAYAAGASGGSVDQVAAKMRAANRKVRVATRILHAADADAADCSSR